MRLYHIINKDICVLRTMPLSITFQQLLTIYGVSGHSTQKETEEYKTWKD